MIANEMMKRGSIERRKNRVPLPDCPKCGNNTFESVAWAFSDSVGKKRNNRWVRCSTCHTPLQSWKGRWKIIGEKELNAATMREKRCADLIRQSSKNQMSYIADLTNNGHIIAVGWLHPDHPVTAGAPPEAFIARLKEFARLAHLTGEAIGAGAMGGVHTCEFCQKFVATNSIYVPKGSNLFSAPVMIYHYVEKHGYLPPSEFIDAVMACPIPGTAEFTKLAAPFHWRARAR